MAARKVKSLRFGSAGESKQNRLHREHRSKKGRTYRPPKKPAYFIKLKKIEKYRDGN